MSTKSKADFLNAMLIHLQNNDNEMAEKELMAYYDLKDNQMKTALTHVTANLHHAVKDVSNQAPSDHSVGVGTDITSRLHYVVSLTEKAAHKTLDIAENIKKTLKVVSSHIEELKNILNEKDFTHLQSLLNVEIDKIKSDLTDLSQTQEYQDLSGQVIKKVINIVLKTEQDLAGILVASVDKNQSGPLCADEKKQVNQIDVDQLLASLSL